MIDYLSLQGSTEYPTFLTIFYTIILAFLLSSTIAFTHKITSRNIIVPINFLQALILMAIVSATVMQAIGDSLARGLGMLGALAIIRFRTTLKTPRNMIFTFASLAAGIACGVYGFVIAVTGTLGFCFTALILRFSPLSQVNSLMGTLKFQLPMSVESDEVENVLKQYSVGFKRIRYQIGKSKIIEEGMEPEDIVNYEYQMKLEKPEIGKIIHSSLKNIEAISLVKINFEDNSEAV